jgi:hypothetical protein
MNDNAGSDDFKAQAEAFSFLNLRKLFEHIAEFVGGEESSSSLKEIIFGGLFTVPAFLLGLMSGKSSINFAYTQYVNRI